MPVFVVASATGKSFPIVVGVAVLVALAADGLRRVHLHWLGRRFRLAHQGRDLLIVYTDSPHWKDYIESNWVTRWQNRSVLLNRSHPWSRKQPEARLWLAVAGLQEHTPLAVVVSPTGRSRVIRFFSAFRNFKHGKDADLRAAEAELEKAMQEAAAGA